MLSLCYDVQLYIAESKNDTLNQCSIFTVNLALRSLKTIIFVIKNHSVKNTRHPQLSSTSLNVFVYYSLFVLVSVNICRDINNTKGLSADYLSLIILEIADTCMIRKNYIQIMFALCSLHFFTCLSG